MKFESYSLNVFNN